MHTVALSLRFHVDSYVVKKSQKLYRFFLRVLRVRGGRGFDCTRRAHLRQERFGVSRWAGLAKTALKTYAQTVHFAY